jgi:hypothetical protein
MLAHYQLKQTEVVHSCQMEQKKCIYFPMRKQEEEDRYNPSP